MQFIVKVDSTGEMFVRRNKTDMARIVSGKANVKELPPNILRHTSYLAKSNWGKLFYLYF